MGKLLVSYLACILYQINEARLKTMSCRKFILYRRQRSARSNVWLNCQAVILSLQPVTPNVNDLFSNSRVANLIAKTISCQAGRL